MGSRIFRIGMASALGMLLAAGTAALAGCGQKGPLYIPQTPAAAQRATLPQTFFGGAREASTPPARNAKSNATAAPDDAAAADGAAAQ